MSALRGDATIESVEPNYVRWCSGGKVPDDPRFADQWALWNTGQRVNGTFGVTGVDTDFLDAWRTMRPSGAGVVVALIDTGADYAHPDLAASLWANPGEVPDNGADDDENGYADDTCGYDFASDDADPSDAGDHGTHVAGIVAATGNNNIGVIGVAAGARLALLKASRDGDTITASAAIEAIQYAAMMKARGVNVVAINASYGGGGYSATERAAILAAGDAGIVFCAAAGNDGANNDSAPVYPASYHLANMIVVAATDQSDHLASFSNYSATSVDLGAPGVNILSALPTDLSTDVHVSLATTSYDAYALSYAGITPGVTGTLYDCGLGYASSFPSGVSGQIALIQRGTLYFSEKVANAMAAGARAAIIYNNTAGSFLGTLQCASNWIPAVSVSQVDGLALRAALPVSVTVANPDVSYQFMDGTSMATPHVAGAVALAAINFPDDDVAQRIQRVLGNVDMAPDLTGKVRTGGRLNLGRIIDADVNGLPDWWEEMHFGTSSGAAPDADADGDGANNLAEWKAGTKPDGTVNSSESRFYRIILEE